MKFVFNIILAISLSACALPKSNVVTEQVDIETIIPKTVELFLKERPKIYSKDSVFAISIMDSIIRLVFQETLQANGNRTRQRVRGRYYDNLIAVGILGSSDFQYFLTPDIIIGQKHKVIPTRFIEKNGKLFLWDDIDYPVTAELLALFHKYNLFLEDTGAVFPNNPMDDSKKGMTYFFCKSNIAKYKTVTSSAALGYFDIPNIKCSK